VGVYPERVVAFNRFDNAVERRFGFGDKGAKHPVPNNQNAGVISVQIRLINAVMDAVACTYAAAFNGGRALRHFVQIGFGITQHAAANSAGAYYTTFLLLFLMGLFFCSVGCFASALTQDQIIAATISFS